MILEIKSTDSNFLVALILWIDNYKTSIPEQTTIVVKKDEKGVNCESTNCLQTWSDH